MKIELLKPEYTIPTGPFEKIKGLQDVYFQDLIKRKDEYIHAVIKKYTKIRMPITATKIKRHKLKIVEINSPEGRKYIYVERAGKILCEDSFNYKLC